jgi:hypothetical protein
VSGPHYTRDFLFVVKGPAADATDALAALRLIVQPCDEDDEKDDQIFKIFPSNVAPVE